VTISNWDNTRPSIHPLINKPLLNPTFLVLASFPAAVDMFPMDLDALGIDFQLI
jgi:hypothetical protein